MADTFREKGRKVKPQTLEGGGWSSVTVNLENTSNAQVVRRHCIAAKAEDCQGYRLNSMPQKLKMTLKERHVVRGP